MTIPDSDKNLDDKNDMRGGHIEHQDMHGSLYDASLVLKDQEEVLLMIIQNLPKSAKELESLSSKNEVTSKLFFDMVRQSFRYLETIRDLQNERDENGYGTDEGKEKDEARGRCHDATISTIDIWVRNLRLAGVDVSFMFDIVRKPINRVVYGNFAVGLALDIYTDKDFDIKKYFIDKIL